MVPPDTELPPSTTLYRLGMDTIRENFELIIISRQAEFGLDVSGHNSISHSKASVFRNVNTTFESGFIATIGQDIVYMRRPLARVFALPPQALRLHNSTSDRADWLVCLRILA